MYDLKESTVIYLHETKKIIASWKKILKDCVKCVYDTLPLNEIMNGAKMKETIYLPL